MASKLLTTIIYLTTLLASSQAFVSPTNGPSRIRRPLETTTRTTTQQLNLFDASMSDVINTNSMWLATIDGDIASIPTNEFGTVFAGGIAVMVGGVLSALVVGFILDKGDLYANVAAESYLQLSDDEEFWKGLSDEERQKAQAVVNKIKESKGQATTQEAVPVTAAVATESSSPSSPAPTTESTPVADASKADMFSDY